MFERKVSQFCQAHNLIAENDRVCLAVSGGPDSLALLHYLMSLKGDLNLSLVVAHLDHMFRGEESLADLQFVKSFCENANLSFESAQIDVPAYMEKTKQSSQVAARECRYNFLAQVIEKHDLNKLALGHHGDDQVETIIMRLTRGSSGAARAGIPVTRDFHHAEIIRPLLSVSKSDIEKYCQEHELNPRIDKTNFEETYLRNRIRQSVLPALQGENQQVHEQFQRFSEEILADEEFLEGLAEEKLNTYITEKNRQKISLQVDGYLSVANSLQRRMIKLILNYLYKNKSVNLLASHIDQVDSLLNSPRPSGTLHLPQGLEVNRSYKICHFQFHTEEVKTYQYEINKVGRITLPTGLQLSFSYEKEFCQIKAQQNKVAYFDCQEVDLPLKVRTRQAGDRMTLKGLKGSKKTKDIFIDEKIPIEKRDTWPIITNSSNEILWLPSLRKSKKVTNNENLSKYLVIKVD